MLNKIKKHLSNSIKTIVSQKEEVIKDNNTFTRTRSLSLDTIFRTILGRSGKSLSKELLDANLSISNSAFVQRRYQIKPEAFYSNFKEFTSRIPYSSSLPILATDGSDICIPRNPSDSLTSIQTRSDRRSYNVLHINSLFDLNRGIFVDVSVQDRRKQNECSSVINMMENSPFR